MSVVQTVALRQRGIVGICVAACVCVYVDETRT